jgi:uncharacterized membrane protein YagU involved in acid resistance
MNFTSVLVVLNEKFNALDVLQDNMKIAGSKIQLLIYNHGLQDPYIIKRPCLFNINYSKRYISQQQIRN